jgi:hypothetical protein
VLGWRAGWNYRAGRRLPTPGLMKTFHCVTRLKPDRQSRCNFFFIRHVSEYIMVICSFVRKKVLCTNVSLIRIKLWWSVLLDWTDRAAIFVCLLKLWRLIYKCICQKLVSDVIHVRMLCKLWPVCVWDFWTYKGWSNGSWRAQNSAFFIAVFEVLMAMKMLFF